MSIQVGTVDGLVNIGPIITDCFVKAIDSFSREGYDYAKNKGVAIGAAFQRYTYPVYSGQSSEFNVTSIDSGVYTKTGNEQSPAYMTYCKKMGLLDVDEKDNRFRLTGLGQMLFNGTITLQEYAFILLTKQGVFVNGIYKNSLMSILYDVLEENPIVTSDSIEKYIVDFYKDKSVDKTRFDILLGAFFAAGLLYKIKNQYVISCIAAAKIIAELKSKENELSPAVLDTNDEYSRYMGAYKYGVFDILNRNNLALFEELYPNIKPVYRIINKTTIGIPYCPYLTALRTKPFMLLAGISGTGKSRIVRKLAQATTTQAYEKEEDRWKDNRPENFELIQVKPNWHNSMDVVGFCSNISKKYEFTPFVEFIVKAWQHKDTPYFLCLDEMNLAPVEEYFAEFLSAIESRSTDSKGNYITDPIIKPFKDFGETIGKNMLKHLFGEADPIDKNPLAVQFYEKGLTLPPNLMVMGTVNMDETTFSFSRKVLDRAMSVEMNEVDYDKFLSGETEAFPLLTDFNALLVNRPQKASEVKDDIDSAKVVEYLKDVNALLEDTPFKLGYRAANEAMLYVAANKELVGEKFSLPTALDELTLMKILSRIEGDDQRLGIDENDPRIAAAHITADTDGDPLNLLTCLRAIVRNHLGNDTLTEKKIASMCRTLDREHFVSYWG